jgi:hypothetical protein
MWIVFTVTIVIGLSGIIFVYFFQISLTENQVDFEESNKLSVSENTIRKHTILISGINNELPANVAEKEIRTLWPQICTECGIAAWRVEKPLVV